MFPTYLNDTKNISLWKEGEKNLVEVDHAEVDHAEVDHTEVNHVEVNHIKVNQIEENQIEENHAKIVKNKYPQIF